MNEFELKFQVDPARRAAVEAAVGRGRSHRSRLRARYYDTADGALAARQIVLRVRKEDGAWVQTAKAPGPSLVERLEHNVELAPQPGAAVPLPQAGRHRGTPVGERIAAALREAGHDPEEAELQPLYGTEVWRTTREMRSGDARIELAFDAGEVRAGERRLPLCELEFELKDGSAVALLELAGRWRDRYGLWLDTVSKAERGERLARGVFHGLPTKASAPPLTPRSGRARLFGAVLERCLAQVLPNASEIAAGSADPEHVHQLRVGLRRLRTGLRELAPFAGARIAPTLEEALADVFRSLGLRRDHDQLLLLQQQWSADGAPPLDLQAGAAALPEPQAVVRAAGFQAALLDLLALAQATSTEVAAQGDTGGREARAVRKALAARLSRLQRQLARDGRRFERLAPERQHRVRKRLKRLRYLGEFAAPLFDSKAAARFLARLEPAQDALGAHNDAAMALAACRDQAAQDGAAWFAVGWLAARRGASAAHCRKALVKAARARPFWTE